MSDFSVTIKISMPLCVFQTKETAAAKINSGQLMFQKKGEPVFLLAADAEDALIKYQLLHPTWKCSTLELLCPEEVMVPVPVAVITDDESAKNLKTLSSESKHEGSEYKSL